MPVLQLLLTSLALLSIVALAVLANRGLGPRPADQDRAADGEESEWLAELSVLQLEERHRVC